MFSSPAYAQSAGAAPSGMAALLASPLPMMAAILAIFYLLVLRPQQKRANEHRKAIDAVKKGDTVVTGGGLIGKVGKVDGAEVEVEIAQGVRVRALKATLSEVRPLASGKPAND